MKLLKFALLILGSMLAGVTGLAESMAALRDGHSRLLPVTSYSTLTKTVVSTSHVSTVCARLFNVTGACGTLGGVAQQPIILTFDEDIDNIDNDLLFQPTKTVSVETTINVQRSMTSTSADIDLESSKDDIGAQEAVRSVFVHHHLLKPLVASFVKVSFVKFVTTTMTSVVVDVYTTKTAYVMGCTPSPFKLPVCKNQK